MVIQLNYTGNNSPALLVNVLCHYFMTQTKISLGLSLLHRPGLSVQLCEPISGMMKDRTLEVSPSELLWQFNTTLNEQTNGMNVSTHEYSWLLISQVQQSNKVLASSTLCSHQYVGKG